MSWSKGFCPGQVVEHQISVHNRIIQQQVMFVRGECFVGKKLIVMANIKSFSLASLSLATVDSIGFCFVLSWGLMIYRRVGAFIAGY
jgi:hypothetical protein